MAKGKSQEQLIIEHMRTKGGITQLIAIGEYRIFNLKGRIADMRIRGVKISTTMKTDHTGKRYATYSLVEEKEHAAA